MKTQERLFWMATAILVVLFAQQKSSEVSNLEFLISTYELESNIQNSQMVDFSQQLNMNREDSYRNGFEAGKTQAAIVLMNEDSLYNYTDGYHAATSQFDLSTQMDQSSINNSLLELLIDTWEMESNSSQGYLEIISDLISKKN